MLMQATQDNRIFLVIEGDEDHRALDAHVSDRHCLLFIAFGKQNVLGAMELAHSNRFAGAVALVDSDRGQVGDETEQAAHGVPPTVVTTSFNDLDSEILHAPGLLDRVAAGTCDRRRLQRRLKGTGLLDAVTGTVAPISSVRAHLLTRGHAPALADFPIYAAYQSGHFRLDPGQFAAIVASATRAADIDALYVSDWYSAEPWKDEDLSRHHDGHHLLEALHAILRHEAGYKSRTSNLADAIRVAVQWEWLETRPFARRIGALAEERGSRVWLRPFSEAATAA